MSSDASLAVTLTEPVIFISSEGVAMAAIDIRRDRRDRRDRLDALHALIAECEERDDWTCNVSMGECLTDVRALLAELMAELPATV